MQYLELETKPKTETKKKNKMFTVKTISTIQEKEENLQVGNFLETDTFSDSFIFKGLQYASKNFESGKNNFQQLLLEYATEKQIPKTQISEFLKCVGKCNAKILVHGGIIFNREVAEFESLEQYIEYLKKYYAEKRERIRNQWIDNRLARKEYCEQVPKTKKEIELCDKKDIAINVIEEYYDKKFFTEANLKKDMILIKERDFD